MEKILRVSGLKKAFGSVKAVDGVDFFAEEGKLFALLGPNGAGKSTTVNILCTLLRPDEGEVSVAGHVLGRDDGAIRASIGVVFQEHLLDPLLTVRENISIRGGFYGLSGKRLTEAVDGALAKTAAAELAGRRYGKLSGGQKRRADIARALVNTPKILFLDEPTAGLDPQTRKSVWDTAALLRAEHGMTVFLTTHYMEEAAPADFVVIVDRGKVAARGTPLQLREQFAKDVLLLSARENGPLKAALSGKSIPFGEKNGALFINLASTLDALPLLNALSGLYENFEVINGTMDDVFLAVTGEEMRA